ncbi:DUF305 domain-containing protein [Actinoplanes flavus]|uniref:DUF305 domain-containing protein n=1 Tax=Actinoplanes flavus TaxID=2820290 RepID=A0ABS3UCR6_9ACTN|nr:DUF305 domain-containing protein [Actinoplanes flavus]MBO3736566.1 DUF305 domain-containing protein [Actinoplanes flavus]
MSGRVVSIRAALSVLIVAVLLAGGVGAVAALQLTQQPDHRYDDASVEAGFVRDMSTHHSQAVELGLLAYAQAPRAEIGIVGRDIAMTQHGQVGIMQAWLREWKLMPTGDQPAMSWMGHTGNTSGGLMPGMASNEELTKLRAATGRDFEIQWAQLMLRHHLGGIDMAKAVLDLSDDEDVRWLAQIMLNGQQTEIATLQEMIDRNGAKPL